MFPVSTTDSRLHTAHGDLFARRWMPSSGVDACAPVVLFHDSLGSVALWRGFPEQLAAATGRDVIAYDRAGFGKSDPHPGALDIHFIHNEARGGFSTVREALELETFVAFGHSVGGAMATACAAAFPDACTALITESAQTFVEERTLEGIRDAKRAFAEPGQLDRLKKHHGGKAAWVLGAWINTWLSDAFSGWTLDDELRRVRCPVLAMHGDRDEYGSPRHLERFASATQARVVTQLLPDCGHVPHREQPAAVIHAVAAFLAEPG